jgi:hypothetical protein
MGPATCEEATGDATRGCCGGIQLRERLQQAMGFYDRIFEGICKPEESILSQELSLTRRVAWQTMTAQVDSDGFWQG